MSAIEQSGAFHDAASNIPFCDTNFRSVSTRALKDIYKITIWPQFAYIERIFSKT